MGSLSRMPRSADDAATAAGPAAAAARAQPRGLPGSGHAAAFATDGARAARIARGRRHRGVHVGDGGTSIRNNLVSVSSARASGKTRRAPGPVEDRHLKLKLNDLKLPPSHRNYPSLSDRAASGSATTRHGYGRRVRPYRAYALEACSVQPATCKLQPATCNLQPASCNLQPAACSLQPAACNLQPATCSLQPATCSLQVATCNLQLAACNLQ
eukprot:gene28919-biopygen70152